MFFSLGPVIRYELITTSRRRRYYVVRVIYGLMLLGQLWLLFRDWEARHPSGGSISEVQAFAEDAFIRFAGVQGLGLLLLIPALVAGLIADEHQRKTLHYLLASRLSSAEIVLGKLGARMVHVVAFIALGLPIVGLLMLYGGLNPVTIFYVYLGTTTLVLFVAGFSILISILARRPRDAILAAYGLGALWLLGPVCLEGISRYLDGPLWWVKPANDGLLMSNPAGVWSMATARNPSAPLTFVPILYSGKIRWIKPVMQPGGWTQIGFERTFGWMAGIQALFGLLFVILAIAGLRPLRGASWPVAKSGTGWRTRVSGRWRRLVESRAAVPLTRNELLGTRAVRPSCGENPMLWKECFTRMSGGLRWLGSRPVALFFAVLLGCYLLDIAAPLIGDLVRGRSHARTSSEVNAALRAAGIALAVLAILPISAAAASSLTSEREQDTWTSLATTLLTSGEIVQAKQLGAIWSARWIGVSLLTIWIASQVLTGFHPIALLAAAFLVSTAWLVAATGVLASALATSSTRALILTFVTLFIYVVLSGWPALLSVSLTPYRDIAFVWHRQLPPGFLCEIFATSPLIGVVFAIVLQSTVAGLLTIWSVRRLRTTWGRA